MNLLFATQSNSLDLFVPLAKEIARHKPVQRVGFTLSDSQHYTRWLKNHGDFENQGYALLKEWEITSALNGVPDLQCLAHYEKKLGLPGLFGAIVADRRLLMGPNCTFTQDYRRRFTDQQLFSILQAAVMRIEKLFDDVKPNLVVTFVCVTLMDYLVHFFAKGRGIRTFNLKSAKLGNQILVATTIRDPAPELVATFDRILQHGSDKLDKAKQFIKTYRDRPERYEGAAAPSNKPAQSIRISAPFAAPYRYLKNWIDYHASGIARDNHVPGFIKPTLFKSILSPYRAIQINRMLARDYLQYEDLTKLNYAFFPLHTEPEVSLMVYSRPILNQLEVVRWLALSLPVDMFLVIKEHPWMVGKRSRNSYRKLLAIPKVRIASPDIEARKLIDKSRLVAVLSSSVGQEAAFLRRPVLTLGPCAFNLLPSTMVEQAKQLYDLDLYIQSILSNYNHDEDKLEAYVAALLECSVPVDLYGGLLQRGGLPSSSSKNRNEDIVRLSKFLRRYKPDVSDVEYPQDGKNFQTIW